MKQEALAYFPYESLRLAGLLIFVVVFTGIWIWVYRRGSRQHYQRMSQLPLNDELDGKESNSHV